MQTKLNQYAGANFSDIKQRKPQSYEWKKEIAAYPFNTSVI